MVSVWYIDVCKLPFCCNGQCYFRFRDSACHPALSLDCQPQSWGSWEISWSAISHSLRHLLPFSRLERRSKLWSRVHLLLFKKKKLMFIYFWDRERQSMSGGGAEREGDTESEAGSRLWTVSAEPTTALELMTMESWLELKSDRHITDWATQVPLVHLL